MIYLLLIGLGIALYGVLDTLLFNWVAYGLKDLRIKWVNPVPRTATVFYSYSDGESWEMFERFATGSIFTNVKPLLISHIGNDPWLHVQGPDTVDSAGSFDEYLNPGRPYGPYEQLYDIDPDLLNASYFDIEADVIDRLSQVVTSAPYKVSVKFYSGYANLERSNDHES